MIIKAALGGGGKGMRTAQSEEEFESCFVTARKEAEKAFGDGTMYIEHLWSILVILNFKSLQIHMEI